MGTQLQYEEVVNIPNQANRIMGSIILDVVRAGAQGWAFGHEKKTRQRNCTSPVFLFRAIVRQPTGASKLRQWPGRQFIN